MHEAVLAESMERHAVLARARGLSKSGEEDEPGKVVKIAGSVDMGWDTRGYKANSGSSEICDDGKGEDGRHKVLDQYICVKDCRTCGARRARKAQLQKKAAALRKQLVEVEAVLSSGSPARRPDKQKQLRLLAELEQLASDIEAETIDEQFKEKHDCRENAHDLDSKAFEARANIGMMARSPTKGGFMVDPLTTDDDSSTRKKAAELLKRVLVVYCGADGEKVEKFLNVVPKDFYTDLNHRIRQFGKEAYKLYDSQTAKYKGIAAQLKRYFSYALRQHKLEDLEDLKKALLNIIEHILGNHEDCLEHFDCPAAKAADAGKPEYKPADLPDQKYLERHHRQRLNELFEKYVQDDKLKQCQHDEKSQANEALNRKKWVYMPKTANFNGTSIGSGRYAAAAGEFNEGKGLHRSEVMARRGFLIKRHTRYMYQIMDRDAAAKYANKRKLTTIARRRERFLLRGSKEKRKVAAEGEPMYESGMALNFAPLAGGDGLDEPAAKRAKTPRQCSNCLRTGTPGHTARTCLVDTGRPAGPKKDVKYPKQSLRLQAGDLLVSLDTEAAYLQCLGGLLEDDLCEFGLVPLEVVATAAGGLKIQRLGEAAGVFESYVKPRRPISARGTGLHKIKDRHVAAAGGYVAVENEMAAKVRQWRGADQHRRVFLLHHNGDSYDARLAARNSERFTSGGTSSTWAMTMAALGVVGTIDTLRLLRDYKGAVIPEALKTNMGDMYAYLYPGVPFPCEGQDNRGKHAALSDALALAQAVTHESWCLLLTTKLVGSALTDWQVYHDGKLARTTWEAKMNAEVAREASEAEAAAAVEAQEAEEREAGVV